MRSANVDKDDGLGRNTIFSNIIKAGEDTGRFAFQEGEVVGNLFTLLFAGHGTTNHASL
jgi:cytochrome P450